MGWFNSSLDSDVFLACITYTARTNPGFVLLADSIAQNSPAAFAWVVVDSELWYQSEQRRIELSLAVAGRFRAVHMAPKTSVHRGPYRITDRDRWDHNGARNTGLLAAVQLGADYVIYQDDCSQVGARWLSAHQEGAARGVATLGWHHVTRLPVESPDACVPRYHRELPRAECAPVEAQGGLIGYPLHHLLAVGGHDEAYAGAYGIDDSEVAVRAARVGLTIERDYSCVVVEYRRGQTPIGSNTGDAHRERFNRLLASDRVLPEVPCKQLQALAGFTADKIEVRVRERRATLNR